MKSKGFGRWKYYYLLSGSVLLVFVVVILISARGGWSSLPHVYGSKSIHVFFQGSFLWLKIYFAISNSIWSGGVCVESHIMASVKICFRSGLFSVAKICLFTAVRCLASVSVQLPAPPNWGGGGDLHLLSIIHWLMKSKSYNTTLRWSRTQDLKASFLHTPSTDSKWDWTCDSFFLHGTEEDESLCSLTIKQLYFTPFNSTLTAEQISGGLNFMEDHKLSWNQNCDSTLETKRLRG